jgi:glycosyltransferase involved in cell wall biosynthesis
LLSNFELGRTEQYEGWLLRQFERTLVTSKTDKDEFTSLIADNKNPPSISVIPNGVDLDYFKPEESAKRESATLVISGKMSYHANISMVIYFVEKIMPLVWERIPDAKLVIVGKDPPKVLKDLAQNPSITVTGTVYDIRPYLRQATISIAPLTYGAGIQNKVLEAMACATPVVASPQAISALSVQLGQDLLVAKEPDDFAKAILQLLENPCLQQQVGCNGRKYVEINHQWSSVAAQLEGVYNEVINTKHQSNN